MGLVYALIGKHTAAQLMLSILSSHIFLSFCHFMGFVVSLVVERRHYVDLLRMSYWFWLVFFRNLLSRPENRLIFSRGILFLKLDILRLSHQLAFLAIFHFCLFLLVFLLKSRSQ